MLTVNPFNNNNLKPEFKLKLNKTSKLINLIKMIPECMFRLEIIEDITVLLTNPCKDLPAKLEPLFPNQLFLCKTLKSLNLISIKMLTLKDKLNKNLTPINLPRIKLKLKKELLDKEINPLMINTLNITVFPPLSKIISIKSKNQPLKLELDDYL